MEINMTTVVTVIIMTLLIVHLVKTSLLLKDTPLLDSNSGITFGVKHFVSFGLF